jgi:putative restriction endonuclease
MAVNQYERAYRAWPLLTARAFERSKVTYSELADYLGIHVRPIRYVLGVIQNWCLAEEKPPLTILVVNKGHGRQGEGFIAWDASDLEQGYRAVYAYPWHDVPNPFEFAMEDATDPERLARTIVVRPQDAADVYQTVKTRGIAQVVFRLALLDAYRGQCAFCGLSFEDALQAAHIIPWSRATAAQRVSPTNGLLLCSTHHALFDAGILGVSRDRKIVCHRSKVSQSHKWTDMDQVIAGALDAKVVKLPIDKRLWPTEAALDYRSGHGG